MGRTVPVTLELRVGSWVANAKEAAQATRGITDELGGLGKTHKDKFNTLAATAGGVGLALTGAFGLITNAAMAFDKQMSEVEAVSGAAGAGLDSLRQAALQAGKDTAFSATEAAKAEAELAKAGVSTSDILGGALTGSLSLAAAGQMDLADAATIAAQAMNLFHLTGRDVGHIADVLAAGANTSAASMGDLGMGLRQGGLVANQFGLSLEDTVGTLSAFADRALIGSDAGTSLKTMLQALANPSKESADLMRHLGIKVYDTSGQFIGITALADQLQKQLGGLTQAQRDQALAQIFGSDAMRAANVLYDQGAAGLTRYIEGVDVMGAAEETARKKMDNLSGDVEKLRGSLETLAITSGEGAAGGLRTLVQMADKVLSSLSQIPQGAQTAGAVIAGIGGALLITAAGLAKIRQHASEVLDALREMGPTGEKAAAGLSKAGAAVNRLTLALVAAQVASAAFGTDATGTLKATSLALTQFGNNSRATLDHLDYDLEALKKGGLAGFANKLAAGIEGITGAGSLFDESVEHARQRFASYDAALAAMVGSGHATDAKAAFDRITEAAQLQGVSIDELAAAFPQYQAATDGSTATQQTNVQVTADQQHKFDLLHGSLRDAIDDLGSLGAAYDALNGKTVGVAQGQINMTQAVDALTRSMKENGNSFDAITVKGAANLDMYLRGAQAARDHAQAVYALTGSVDQANWTFQDDIGKLDGMARSGGATAGKIQELHDKYAQLPPLVSTTVTTPGLPGATAGVKSFRDMINDIPPYTVAYVEMRQRINAPGSMGHPQRWGGIYTHAATGALRDAAVYSPVSPARYAFAEPATRGEAFVPRSGDYGRSTAILDQASRWYGGRFVAGGAGGTASGRGETVVNAYVTINAGLGTNGAQLGQQVADVLRPYVSSKGGNVQVALGRAGQ